jgi:hypothetical protein
MRFRRVFFFNPNLDKASNFQSFSLNIFAMCDIDFQYLAKFGIFVKMCIYF